MLESVPYSCNNGSCKCNPFSICLVLDRTKQPTLQIHKKKKTLEVGELGVVVRNAALVTKIPESNCFDRESPLPILPASLCGDEQFEATAPVDKADDQLERMSADGMNGKDTGLVGKCSEPDCMDSSPASGSGDEQSEAGTPCCSSFSLLPCLKEMKSYKFKYTVLYNISSTLCSWWRKLNLIPTPLKGHHCLNRE